jgi:hypothetical protein
MTRRVGRPSSYSALIAAEICDRLADGEGLVAICHQKHLPSRETVHRWLNGDQGAPPEFRHMYDVAHGLQADLFAERVRSEVEAPLPDDPQQARVELERRREVVKSLKWSAARMSPRKWGDKVEVGVSGVEGKPPIAAVVIDTAPMLSDERLRSLAHRVQIEAGAQGSDRG